MLDLIKSCGRGGLTKMNGQAMVEQMNRQINNQMDISTPWTAFAAENGGKKLVYNYFNWILKKCLLWILTPS